MTDIIYSTARTDLETLLQYNFTDVAVLKEALTAFPTSIDWKRIQEGNKRLALVGDAAMNVVVAKEAYRADVSKGTFRIPQAKPCVDGDSSVPSIMPSIAAWEASHSPAMSTRLFIHADYE